MKNPKSILTYLVAALVFSLFACANDNYKTTTTTIKVDPTNREKIVFSEIFDSVRYVKLETTDDILIKEINTIKYTNNCIYILDEPTLTLFSFDAITGKCLWKIRNIGQGPGEYTRTTDFDVDEKNDRLYLFCHYRKIQEYDLSGNFITEYNMQGLSGMSIACDGDYLYIYAGNNSSRINNQKSFYYLLIYNKKDGSLRGELPFENNPNLGSTRVYTKHNDVFYRYNDEVRFFSPYTSQNIYSIKGNEVNIAYRFDFGKYNLPNSLSDYSSFEELDQIDYAYGLNSGWENDQYLHISVMKNPYFMTEIFYSKKDKKVIAGNFADDVVSVMPMFVLGTDDFLLGYKPAEHCFLTNTVLKGKNALIQKITTEIKEDDNPVLFFYYFKKNNS